MSYKKHNSRISKLLNFRYKLFLHSKEFNNNFQYIFLYKSKKN